ncbi:MAG: hypothetical protein ACXU8A_00120 [Burkholderiaceae bacterium]
MKYILLVVLALSGCATNSWSWYKENSSQQDFNMDNGQCRAQAFGIPNAPLMQIVMVQQACMEGRGWEKRNNQ